MIVLGAVTVVVAAIVAAVAGSLTSMSAPDVLVLVLLGFAVGAFGTLIGTGGGVVLTPVLLIIDTSASVSTVTAISLMTVFFNAGSGSVAYARQRRIDFRTGGRTVRSWPAS